MSIQEFILNKYAMVVGDRPALFEGAVKNPSELVTWDDVQHCLNNPWWYNIEILDNGLHFEILNCKQRPWAYKIDLDVIVYKAYRQLLSYSTTSKPLLLD